MTHIPALAGTVIDFADASKRVYCHRIAYEVVWKTRFHQFSD